MSLLLSAVKRGLGTPRLQLQAAALTTTAVACQQPKQRPAADKVTLEEVATPRAPRQVSADAQELRELLRRNDFGAPRRTRPTTGFNGNNGLQSGTAAGAASQGSHASFSHSRNDSSPVIPTK